ncbi:hypothetical protein K3725_22185 (plasmid) [Leisingera sp. S132]|uniref:phage head spike fiber domain-containing protein n=1 Tax=Leisingera sp. S132 TaxID=2867016 RepID=UPI0021A27C7C|nr:hypothetical protein [Leisingera sp. S132]UWQ81922.1 hypothetical protein K3725_22185 [Leisingera sp. S132]
MLNTGLSLTGAAAQGRWPPPAALTDLDFRQDRYVLAGTERRFDEVFTYSGTGPRTFTGPAGDCLWAAHNLVLNSETPASQTISVAAAAGYTVAMEGSGSAALSGAAAGVATGGSPAVVTAGSGALTLTLSGTVTRLWAYRSDLGGMADNPDNILGAGFETYVPSGAAPAFTARRKAYAGGAPAGVLLEDAAAVNIIAQSHDFSNAYWLKNNQLAVAASGTIAGIPAWDLTDSGSTAFAYCTASIGAIAGVHTASCLVRKNPSQTSLFSARLSVGSNQFCGISFDTLTGTITNKWNNGLVVQSNGDHMRGAIDMGSFWLVWFTYDPSLLTGLDASADFQVFPAHDGLASSPGPQVMGSHACTAFQVTAGYTPGSFIPTAGSPAARAAETLALRAPALPAGMPHAVSVAFDGRLRFADTGSAAAARFFDWQAGAGTVLRAELNTGGTATGQIRVFSEQSGAASTASGPAAAYAPGLDVPVSFAARHQAGVLELSAQGEAAPGLPAPSALPDLAAAGIGLAPVFNGHLGRFRIWDEDLGSGGARRVTA